MFEEYINDNLDVLNDIDTSEIDNNLEETSTFELNEQFVVDEFCVNISEDICDLDDKFHLYSEDLEIEDGNQSQQEETRHNEISFKGHGKCKLCGCGKWVGYGNVCKNCGHFYVNHYSL